MSEKLRAAVLASPEDDAPRLVYADWLLERGDARGEFIQIQCALGRSLHGAKGYVYRSDPEAKNPPTKEELEKREKELLRKHQKTWIAPIRPYIRTWQWKRGFVEGVNADGGTFARGADIIFSETPLHQAELQGMKDADFELLANASALRSLPWLSLAQQRIGPKTAFVLKSPYFCGLRELVLWGNPLKDAGLAILGSAKHLDNLETLDVSRTDGGILGLEALTKGVFFPRLKKLDLSVGYRNKGQSCGPAGAEYLLRGESLVSLSLAGCKIGDEGIKTLASSPALANLEEINLHANEITDDGAIALAASTHLKSLRRIKSLVGAYNELPEDSRGAQALRERFGDGIDD